MRRKLGIRKITTHELEMLFWKYDELEYYVTDICADQHYLRDCGYEIETSEDGWARVIGENGIRPSWMGDTGYICKEASQMTKARFIEMVNKGLCIIMRGVITAKYDDLNWEEWEDD